MWTLNGTVATLTMHRNSSLASRRTQRRVLFT